MKQKKFIMGVLSRMLIIADMITEKPHKTIWLNNIVNDNGIH